MILDKLFGRPSAAITESSELAKLLGAGGTNAGVSVTPDSALRVTAVYACIMVISETVAQLPFILYERDGRKKRRATDRKLYSLLHDAPNSFQTSFEWRMTKVAHALTRGAGYSYINRNPVTGEPLELLPMHPDRVKVEQLRDYSLRYTFRDGEGKLVPLRQDQVYRIMAFSMDGVTPSNPLEYHRQTVGIAMAADKHTALSFKNGAKMTGILRNESHFSSDEVAKRVRESWDEAFSGDNAYKTPLLEDGLDWKQVQMTNKDAQYIETRQFQVEDICRIFRVPPHKVQHLLRATFNNIEHQGLEFVQDTILPWNIRLEQAAVRDLLSLADRRRYFPELLVEGLLRGDSKTRAEYYSSAIQNGWMSPNEAREKENMDPRENGDEFYRPLNMEPTGGSNQ